MQMKILILLFSILILSSVNNFTVAQSGNFSSSNPDISNDKIVFVSDRAGGRHIFTTDYNGENVAQLTTEGFNVMPSWSEDGKKIAFIRRVEGTFQIFTMNMDGSEQTQLTNHPAHCFAPRWSPNGKFIAFGSQKDGDTEIFVINSDGSNEVQLTNNFVDDDRPEWSPDGDQIFYGHLGLNREWHLYRIDIDNRITEKFVDEDSSSPAISPDGQHILYDAKKGKLYVVHQVDMNGKITELLSSPNYAFHSPEFSPDGTKIAFVSDEEGYNEIYISNSNGSNKQRVTYSNK